MKKLMMAIMLVVMMASMSLTAYADERVNLKKVTEFYADEVIYGLPHTKLSDEEVTHVDDDATVRISEDGDGIINMEINNAGHVVCADVAVYTDGNNMVMFYVIDGEEYAETINNSAYAEEFYNR
jgi:uncharacterized protein YuzE